MDGVDASRKSPHAKRGRAGPMDTEGEDDGLVLRPLKPPVTPVAKADLLPPPRISVTQSALIGRLAPDVDVDQEESDSPALATKPALEPAPERPAPLREAGPRRSSAEPAQEADASKPQLEPWGRRSRSVEAPEPVERRHAPREFYVPEWDRYYNPGFLPGARSPALHIDRAGGPSPDAPSWMLVGRPRGMGQVSQSQAPYRASLRDGGRVKPSKPDREVGRFLEQRGDSSEPVDLDGPTSVPVEEPEPDREPLRRAEFERALADLEASFRAEAAPPARATLPAASTPAPPALPPARALPAQSGRAAASAARPEAAVEAAVNRAMPIQRRVLHAVARRRGDEASEEDESEIAPGEEEEGTLGRAPPPDHLQEAAAHRALEHDATGASLCPTCGRRVSASNPVLVCTSCGRVACGACGKFSAGEPLTNIYRYEYKFNFPLCQPCFERHYTVQQNLARGRAYLSSGNLTYAFYHAQTALQSDPESPYATEAQELVKQVEQRRGQNQKAEKEWEEARKKIMRDRTTVLK